jgi:hypothetical protein
VGVDAVLVAAGSSASMQPTIVREATSMLLVKHHKQKEIKAEGGNRYMDARTSSMELETAELPMLALTFVKNLRPG